MSPHPPHPACVRDELPARSRPRGIAARHHGRDMLKRLYDWLLRLAAGRHATAALAAVAFVESSFFPLPPDILLIPMALAQPRRAWWFAAICTVSSVAGGFLGYAIGYYLFDAIGRPVLEFYGAMGRYEA